MTRSARIVSTLFLALCLAWAATAQAQGPPPGVGRHGMNGGFPLGKVLRHMDLTADQRTQLAEILKAQREEMRGSFDATRTAMKELNALMFADTLDEEALRQAHRKVADLREARLISRARTLAEIRPILTPEQWNLLKERALGGPGRMRGPGPCMEWAGDSLTDPEEN